MNLDEILSAPGFTVDEQGADNLRCILECLEADFVSSGGGEIDMIVPDHDTKCVTIIFVTNYLASEPRHNGGYLANLFRVADAVGIYPARGGRVRVLFSCTAWE